MKRFLKILFVIILLFFAAMIILPIVFKGQIMELAKTEINKNVDAEVDFEDFGLSLLTSFPNFTASLEGLSVKGKGEFEGQSLMKADDIRIRLDLMDVIGGDSYNVKSIEIINPEIKLITRADSASNWDIAPADAAASQESTHSTSAEPSAGDESDPVKLKLQSFTISNANIRYTDELMKMDLLITGLNHKLSGDLSEDITVLNTLTEIADIQFDYEGVRYMNDMHMHAKADIEADLKNGIYTFKKNTVQLNNLSMGFDGSVAMVGEDINTQLTFNTKETAFRDLLSMIPSVFADQLEGLKTEGSFSVDGMVKGTYTEESLPAFRISLKAQNGVIQYPDLPSPITAIALEAHVENPGGDIDNTVLDLKKFHLEILKNPVDARLKVTTPVSDPAIESHIAGKMNLADISKVYPLDSGDQMKGEFRADIELKGKVSELEKGNYDNFVAIGSLLVKNFSYETSALNDEVAISTAQLNFSPEYLDLVSFKSKIGRNDLNASGKIRNYMAYAMKGEELYGQLKFTSKYLNLNDLIPEEEAAAENEAIQDETAANETEGKAAEEEIPLEVIEIPGNIKFVLASKIDELIYDKLVMKNVIGIISLDDHRATLQNLSMNALKGKMKVNGFYDTQKPEKPQVDFDMKLTDVDIQECYKTFASFESLVPVAENTTGTFTTNFDMNLFLDNKMEPLLESMQASGNLKTSKLDIKSGNALSKLADQLKMPQFKSLKLDPVDLSFIIEDGKVKVKPFPFKYGKYSGMIGGYTSLDRTMNYDMTLAIPMSELGSGVNNALAGLASKGIKVGKDDKVNVGIKIEGTVEKPKVKADLSKAAGDAMKNLQKQAEDEFNKKKKEMEEKAKKELEKKAKSEGDKLKKKVEEEAKKVLEGWF